MADGTTAVARSKVSIPVKKNTMQLRRIIKYAQSE
jgi:hypothetical protein